MSRPANLNLTLVFEGGCKLDQSAERIAGISYDARSWVGFLKMLAGGAPADMKAVCEDGTVERFKVAYRGDLKSDAGFDDT